jgi:translation initiation factor 4E
VSPTTSASSAFGLGSGAFASFGSAKTPKSPGNPFESALGAAAKTPTAEKSAKEGGLSGKAIGKPASNASLADAAKAATQPTGGSAPAAHQLRNSWVFWFRPPISKANGIIEYEKTLHPIATVETVEHFFKVYQHLKRPSTLPLVSDYHLFKKGIRPIWEDEENKNGGKWVVRLRKGVADRYWEDLLFAIIGDQFGEASEEVCGAVLSVRNGEDILSIWARANGQRVLKIRYVSFLMSEAAPVHLLT